MAKKGKDSEETGGISRYIENTNQIFLRIMSISFYTAFFLIASKFQSYKFSFPIHGISGLFKRIHFV